MTTTTGVWVLLATGCVRAAAGPSEPVAPGPEVTSQAAGSVLTLDTAPRFVAGSGKAWITRLAEGENAFMGMLELAPGAAVPEHQDATEEYIYFLSGSGTLTMAGTRYEVGAGSLVYMPAGITVSYQNGDTPLVALQVFAGPAPAKKYDNWLPADRMATP